MRSQRGMTLLEILVALTVFAIAGLAAMKTANEHVVGLSALEEKTLAYWVAENELVELRLAKIWPSPQWIEGKTELAGRQWSWRYRGQPTADDKFRALDIEVHNEANALRAYLRTYVYRP